MRDATFDYRPRQPETTILYQVVTEQLETFLSRQEGRDYPAFYVEWRVQAGRAKDLRQDFGRTYHQH